MVAVHAAFLVTMVHTTCGSFRTWFYWRPVSELVDLCWLGPKFGGKEIGVFMD